MIKNIALAAALAASGGAAHSAHAANMQVACTIVPCVYDSSTPPQIVGVFQQTPQPNALNPENDVELRNSSIALRQVAGTWYQINVGRDGLWGDLGETHLDNFELYTAANCTDHPVIIIAVVPDTRGGNPVPVVQTAFWDGISLWAANVQAATTVPAVYSLRGTACSPVTIPGADEFGPDFRLLVGPATQIESPRFVGPLTVK